MPSVAALPSAFPAAAAGAEPVEVEPRVVGLEAVPLVDRPEDRSEEALVEVLDPLAAGADEVVVVLGRARDVRGHAARPLEPAGHSGLDLRLERTVDRREAEPRVPRSQLLEELLRGDRLPCRRERFGDDHPLRRHSAQSAHVDDRILLTMRIILR